MKHLLILMMMILGIVSCNKEEDNDPAPSTCKTVDYTNMATGDSGDYVVYYTDGTRDLRDRYYQSGDQICD